MPVRNIVKIDAEKCNGCALCVNACVEGAIALIDGKAVLVKDEYCDGLGACLPACPTDAITIEKRDAPDFDEEAALAHAAGKKAPAATASGHVPAHAAAHGGCPSARLMAFGGPKSGHEHPPETGPADSELRHWPVQLALVPPTAPFLKGADVVLAADCVPFAYAGFHRNFLSGKAVLVACPKLDDIQTHVEKLIDVFRQSGLKSLTVVRMEVPCCSGLVRAAQHARKAAGSDTPLHEVVIGIRGEVQRDSRGGG